MTLLSRLIAAVVLLASATTVATAQSPKPAPAKVSLASLTATTVSHGFKANAVYLDAAGKPIGARFTHEQSGFILDLIREQSVPQAHIWVNTFAMTDRGEPHTQEHLLVAKGNKGRALGTIESASLASFGAFTEQWRTAYQFNTSAGAKAFYTLLDKHLDALLNPDFTDEEIRREVRGFGITDDPATKSLGLEEKGSVYNEMVASTASPYGPVYREMLGLVFGREHPLARQSGGMPEGIREMTTAHIRQFHREHYYLGNMGMAIALPDAMLLDDVLNRLGEMLVKYNRPAQAKATISSLSELPAPAQAPEGTIRMAPYPNASVQQPSPLIFAWPATRTMSVEELNFLNLFLSTIAGDPTTNLYKIFIDTKTRTMNIGADGVYAYADGDPGHMVGIQMSSVQPAHMTVAEIGTIRSAIMAELKRIAAFPDGSPALAEFNERLKSRIVAGRRSMSKFVNSPPGFGFRNTGGFVMSHLDQVNRTAGFRKSLVLAPAMAYADSIMAGTTNPWRTLLPRWQLTTTTPYASAAIPDSAMVRIEDADRKARVAAEVVRLRSVYAVNDDQVAINRYKADYDRNTTELDRLAASLPPTKLVDDVPMTLDDQLKYTTERIRGVPVVSSTFESVTSLTAGLALRTDGVREDELVYLTALPSLLGQVGLFKNGIAESYDAMSERQLHDILFAGASWSTNPSTGRVELMMSAAGNDAREATKALDWMRDLLTSADWRVENLSRIREVVDQNLSGGRTVQQSPPEYWVQLVSSAYRMQGNPRYLATQSHLTGNHLLLRLKWLFTDPGDAAQRAALDGWLGRLAAPVGGSARTNLLALLTDSTKSGTAALAPAAKALATELAGDLAQALGEIPDESIAGDWSYLVQQLREDLLTPPATALARLGAMRDRLLTTGNARMYVVSASATRRSSAPALSRLLGALRVAPASPTTIASRPVVAERLGARTSGGAKPVYVGLVDQNMLGGVMMFGVRGVAYADTSTRALMRFLASRLYAGGGAHSIFAQTIGAGLAYSNGIGGSPSGGRVGYYAERTPEIPQTLAFVVEQLKKSPRDTSLTNYVMTQVFAETRAGSSFEERGEAIAADLADGLTPALVRRFREKVLALRRTTPDLGKRLYGVMDSIYADLLPGYSPGTPAPRDGIYVTIGAEKQLSAFEKYLKANVSPTAELYRLYARDFWIVGEKKKTVP